MIIVSIKTTKVYRMYENGKMITDSSKIMKILHKCRSDNMVFEAVDAQDNLFSLGLEKIETSSASDAKALFPESHDPIQGVFKPLQKGASEMRMNCDYAFCFQHHGNVYSFNGKLLGADPEKFVLTYLLENKLFRHQLRQSNRLIIDALDRVSVEIGNRTYGLINICAGGIGIIVDKPGIFQIGKTVPVKLLSENNTLDATGSVRHIAPLTGNGFICGISIVYSDENGLEQIRRFIHQTRQNRTHLCRVNLLLR
jgi:hypothetical protein